MLRPLEDVLTLLTSAGFSGQMPCTSTGALGYLHGHILTELQEVIERPEETDDVLRLGPAPAHGDRVPQLRALASLWPITTAPPSSTAASISCCWV